MSRPPKPPFEIIEAKQGELLQACFDIRIEVFVTEQQFPLEEEIDNYDKIAVAFLLNILEGSDSSGTEPKRIPAGTIRIVPGKNKVGRLAVAKPYRSCGFGRDLMLKVHEWAAKNGKASGDHGKISLNLEAQMYAIPFYERMGYKSEGEPYMVDGALHQLMIAEIDPRQ